MLRPRLDPIPTFNILQPVGNQLVVDEARADLNVRLPEGAACPCCEQNAKTYRRKVTSGMARLLIDIYKVFKLRGFPKGFDDAKSWLHLPTFIRRNRIFANGSNDAAMMVHWGLVERADDIIVTGNAPKAFSDFRGLYRITELGVAFVAGSVSIPRFLYIYNNNIVGRDKEQTAIQETLTDKLDFNELMGAAVTDG